MATVIDSSLWVDYFRFKTPPVIKRAVIEYVNDADATLCDPIRFEILRATLKRERRRVEAVFATFPVLPTPPNLWDEAIQLGQRCQDAGFQPHSLDLLIGCICLHHKATLVTFDSHFAELAKVSPLQVRLLKRG